MKVGGLTHPDFKIYSNQNCSTGEKTDIRPKNIIAQTEDLTYMVKWFSIRVPILQQGKDSFFNKQSWENWVVTNKIMKFNPLANNHIQKLTQNGSDINARVTTIKLHDSGLGNEFLDMWIWHQRHRQQKKNKLNFIRIRNLCIKGYYWQNKNATHRMEENNCKSHIW